MIVQLKKLFFVFSIEKNDKVMVKNVCGVWAKYGQYLAIIMIFSYFKNFCNDTGIIQFLCLDYTQ